MSRWGREAAGAAAIAGAPTAYLAKRSILCVVIAYVIAVAAFVVAFRMPGDIPPPWPTLVPLTVGILFAIVVPVIHIVGVVYGARALSRPAESRVLAGLGIGLNLLSIAGVVFAVWALMAPQAG